MKVPFLFASLIPKEYQPLLSAVSPVAFSVVDWKRVLNDAPTLIRRLSEKSGVENLKKSLERYWQPHPEPFDLGGAVLELYFAQIFNPNGLFLDLRRRHFSVKDNKISFSPNGFWVQLEDPFRMGLVDIYSGYYDENPEQIDRGLFQVGLFNDKMANHEKLEVKNMLLSHIGGHFRQQKFLVSDFTASFERFFHFLLDKKMRLSADFLYLGIYLASLYNCLQEEGGAYDVQRCFRNAQLQKTNVTQII